MTPRQAIQVDALGRPMGEYREDSPVTLGALGAQTIQRFSIIHHDEPSQMFFIEFRETAPYDWCGRLLYPLTAYAYCPKAMVAEGTDFKGIDWHGEMHYVVTFPTYALAVQAEREVIATAMQNGELHA